MTGWWERHSLRARLMAVGLVGLAVAQAVGSVGLVVALSVASRRALDRSAVATADQVVQLVAAGRLPNPIPVTGSESVQVVNARGEVLSASANGDRLTSLLTPDELRAARRTPVTVSGARLGMSSSLRVTVTPSGTRADAPVVVVAEPVADLTRSRHQLVTTLLVISPLLLLLLAVIAWRVIGAALRPVEGLRSAAERVSGTGDGERLPEPASRDEIHALAVTLNSMLDRLAAARDRERDFVANVAHELRSPLASLRLQLDVSRRHGPAPADDEVAADLAAEVDRLVAIVEDLLVLARLDAGEQLAAPHPVASPVVSLAEATARAEATPGPRVTMGHADPGTLPLTELELDRVLANLLGNARRHAAGRVDVSFRVTHAERVLAVADDGPGIAEADHELVFARFARLDDARDRDRGGTGLGLSIVRELVRRRGGDVRLGESAKGGLLVEVTFPP